MSNKVFSDILFGENLERLAELLKQSLLEGLFSGSHDYKPDPFKDEFRASQAPYCSRKLVFSNVLGSNSKPESKMDDYQVYDKRAIMNSGTLIHHIKQSLLEISKLSVVNEGEMKLVSSGITIFGHMDIVVLQFEPNYIVCIDIKTKDELGYLDYYFNTDPELLKQKQLNDPTHHNRIQLNLYLQYLRKKYPKKFVFGILWYIRRVYGSEQLIHMLHPINWRFFFSDYSSEMWNKTLDKLLNISKCLKEGVLPTFDNEKWECANKTATCDYLTLCFSEREKITNVAELFELKRNEQDG